MEPEIRIEALRFDPHKCESHENGKEGQMLGRQTVVFHALAHRCEHSQRLSEDHSTRGSAGTWSTITFLSHLILAYQLHGTFRLESKRIVVRLRQSLR